MGNIYSANLLETVTPRQLSRLTLACLCQTSREAGESTESAPAYARQRVIKVLGSRQTRHQARLAAVLMQV